MTALVAAIEAAITESESLARQRDRAERLYLEALDEVHALKDELVKVRERAERAESRYADALVEIKALHDAITETLARLR